MAPSSEAEITSDLPFDAPAEESPEGTAAWLNGTVAEQIEESPSYEDESIANAALPGGEIDGQERTSEDEEAADGEEKPRRRPHPGGADGAAPPPSRSRSMSWCLAAWAVG